MHGGTPHGEGGTWKVQAKPPEVLVKGVQTTEEPRHVTVTWDETAKSEPESVTVVPTGPDRGEMLRTGVLETAKDAGAKWPGESTPVNG